MMTAEVESNGRTGRLEGAWHVLPLRVYWEDTDAAGIVYYANYLRFIERGRSDLLRHLGISQSRLQKQDGVAFAVRDCRISYLRPARLDDELEVHTRITSMGGATLGAEQVVKRVDGEEREDLVITELRLACISPEGRPRRLPAAVREALATMGGGGESPGKNPERG